jgi:glycosyltransferase involved in cell wall biosynthesis
MSLRIAIVLPSFNIGGLETSMLRIGSHFLKAGHSVWIITTQVPGLWFPRIAEAGFHGEHIDGARSFNAINHSCRVGSYLANMAFDVVFTVFDRFSQASLSMLGEQTLVIPLLRNDHPHVYEIGLSNSRRWNVAVGNSPKVCKAARALLLDREVLLIPNGVEVSTTDHPDPRWPLKGTIQALFAGRLTDESKRVLQLPTIMACAIEQGLDLRLTIAGDGPDASRLMDTFQQRGLSDYVQWAGYTSPSKLTELYQQSHILLFTSAYEGLPNVLLECQAQGCVPIATRLPGITDFLIQDGKTGCLVPPEEPETFAQCLVELCSQPLQLEALSQNGRAWIRSHFSQAHEADLFLSLIDRAQKGSYQLETKRHARMLDLSLFPPAYWYRQVLRPSLTPIYRSIQRALRSLRQAEDPC